MAAHPRPRSGLTETVAIVAIIGGLNYALVRWGFKPYAYCWGSRFLEAAGVTAWYQAVTILTALLAVGVGITRGLAHGARYALAAAFLCILPHWLDQGFRLGQSCGAP